MADFYTRAAIKSLMKKGINKKRAEEIVQLFVEERDFNSVNRPEFIEGLADLKSELLKWCVVIAILSITIMTIIIIILFTIFGH